MRLFLLSLVAVATPDLPTEWDPRVLYPACAAWRPYDENATGCASCCALALAAALSARDCLRDGRDRSRFSGQQIWDCAGGDWSTCSGGTSLDRMVEALGAGLYANYALIPEDCSGGGLPPLLSDPNRTACMARFGGCLKQQASSSFFQGVTLQESVGYSQEGIRFDGNGQAAMLPLSLGNGSDTMMMREIMARGPVVSVLVLAESDMRAFIQRGGGAGVFTAKVWPLWGTGTAVRAHCLSVIGWGTSAQEGPYYIVQNSYTAAWGSEGGFARVARALLEASWQAPLPVSRPSCVGCLYAAGGYPPITTTTTTPPPPPVDVPLPLSNAAIIGIALSAAMVISALAVMVFLYDDRKP